MYGTEGTKGRRVGTPIPNRGEPRAIPVCGGFGTADLNWEGGGEGISQGRRGSHPYQRKKGFEGDDEDENDDDGNGDFPP